MPRPRFQFSLRTLMATTLGASLVSVAYAAWPRSGIDPKSAAIIFCACWYLGWSLPVVSFAFDQNDAISRQHVVLAGLSISTVTAFGALLFFMMTHPMPP